MGVPKGWTISPGTLWAVAQGIFTWSHALTVGGCIMDMPRACVVPPWVFALDSRTKNKHVSHLSAYYNARKKKIYIYIHENQHAEFIFCIEFPDPWHLQPLSPGKCLLMSLVIAMWCALKWLWSELNGHFGQFHSYFSRFHFLTKTAFLGLVQVNKEQRMCIKCIIYLQLAETYKWGISSYEFIIKMYYY